MPSCSNLCQIKLIPDKTNIQLQFVFRSKMSPRRFYCSALTKASCFSSSKLPLEQLASRYFWQIYLGGFDGFHNTIHTFSCFRSLLSMKWIPFLLLWKTNWRRFYLSVLLSMIKFPHNMVQVLWTHECVKGKANKRNWR